MKRREVLRNIGIGTVGVAGAGNTVGATGSEYGPEFTIKTLEENELSRLKSKLYRQDDIQQLIDQAAEMGWSPKWNDINGKRKYVYGESASGRYDTIVIPFETEAVEDSENTVFLTWNGNDTIGIDESPYQAFDYILSGATLTHIDYKSDAFGVSGVPEPHEYRVNNGAIEVRTATDVIGNQSLLSSVPGGPILDPGPGGGDVYCEVDVKILPANISPLGCMDLECFNVETGASLAAIWGCILSMGWVCLFGLFFASYGAIDCVTCDHSDAVVEFEVDWLEEEFGGIEGVDPHPCVATAPGTPQYIPLSKCELEDAPTKEEYNYPECE